MSDYNLKFQYASDIKLKSLQRARLQNKNNTSSFLSKCLQRTSYWIKIFLSCQKCRFFWHFNMLTSHLYNTKICIQNIRCGFNSLLESDTSGLVRAVLKSMILNWKFYYVSDFELKKYNALDFGLKKIQRVRFWTEKVTTRQILNWKNIVLSNYQLRRLQRVRSLIKIFSYFFIWSSNPVPPHELFTSFPSI